MHTHTPRGGHTAIGVRVEAGEKMLLIRLRYSYPFCDWSGPQGSWNVHMMNPVNLRAISDSQSRRENANRMFGSVDKDTVPFATHCHTVIPLPVVQIWKYRPPSSYFSLEALYMI